MPILHSLNMTRKIISKLICMATIVSASLAPIKLTADDGINTPLIGAYLPHDGRSVSVLENYQQITGKELAYVNVFSNFSHRWEWHLKYQTRNIAQVDSTPMISWMPIDYSRREINILPEITMGKRDNYIHNWAKNVVKWASNTPENLPNTLLLRFAHEFNGIWYSYGNDPFELVQAWRHVHDIFSQENANQFVQWVWSPNNVSVDDYDDIHAYYPGDDYVDWTAIDGYNWGSNYSFTRWKSFTEVFTNTYLELVNHYPEKPIMIAELGCAEPKDKPSKRLGYNGDDSDKNESKDEWLKSALVALTANFPAIRAVTLFNKNKNLSWAIYGYSHHGFENNGVNGLKTAAQETTLTFKTPNKFSLNDSL